MIVASGVERRPLYNLFYSFLSFYFVMHDTFIFYSSIWLIHVGQTLCVFIHFLRFVVKTDGSLLLNMHSGGTLEAPKRAKYKNLLKTHWNWLDGCSVVISSRLSEDVVLHLIDKGMDCTNANLIWYQFKLVVELLSMLPLIRLFKVNWLILLGAY